MTPFLVQVRVSQAEVHQVNRRVCCVTAHQDVVWLQVAMDVALSMEGLEPQDLRAIIENVDCVRSDA